MKKEDKYQNINPIEIVKITNLSLPNLKTLIITEKDRMKFIESVKRMVRSSMEYKQYIQFVRDNIDMNRCAFFRNVDRLKGKRVSIEVHHEPFALSHIVQSVVTKYEEEDLGFNIFEISEEVLKLHYQNKIGLIPLSSTVHELVTNGQLFIPLQYVYGNYVDFLIEYDKYIHEDIKSILQKKLELSKDPKNCDMSILEKKFLYLETEGIEELNSINN